MRALPTSCLSDGSPDQPGHQPDQSGHGRPRTEYVCPLAAVGAVLILDQAETHAREREAAQTAARADVVLAAGAEFDRLADQVLWAVMFLTGHRLHRRTEWRRKRGEPAMAQLHDLMSNHRPADPAPALIRQVSKVPEHQTII